MANGALQHERLLERVGLDGSGIAFQWRQGGGKSETASRTLRACTQE